MIYENDTLYFVWKPHWIASTFWKRRSILDDLEQWGHTFSHPVSSHWTWAKRVEDAIIAKKEYLGISPAQHAEAIEHFLLTHFSKAEEYGLLNRLDVPTSWFLYFAKNRELAINYKLYQLEKRVKKYYIAQLKWDIRFFFEKNPAWRIEYPLMHHRHLNDRMVAVVVPTHEKKWRWELQDAETTVELLHFEEETQVSTVKVEITQWKRHQIRAHCAALWYPVLWDDIYWKWHHHDHLHLRSVWCKIV